MTLVRRHRVHSQEQLRGLLKDQGIEVTQATLSRDIQDLRLSKMADPLDGSFYAAPPSTEPLPPPSLEQLLPALVLSVDGVGPMLVVKTPAGSAEALGSALDGQQWPEIIGCLAGDDTMLIVARSERARRTVAARLKELSGAS